MTKNKRLNYCPKDERIENYLTTQLQINSSATKIRLNFLTTNQLLSYNNLQTLIYKKEKT